MEKMREYYAVQARPGAKRCKWAQGDILAAYHDTDYGVIKTTNESIFEQICLAMLCEGQLLPAIIQKRGDIREVFRGYDLLACANMSDKRLKLIAEYLALPYGKVQAVRHNARVAQNIAEKHNGLFKPLYRYCKPERLLAAMQIAGFAQMDLVTVTCFMKCLGIVEAHEPGCHKRIYAIEE